MLRRRSARVWFRYWRARRQGRNVLFVGTPAKRYFKVIEVIDPG
jgi:hypothetical protein